MNDYDQLTNCPLCNSPLIEYYERGRKYCDTIVTTVNPTYKVVHFEIYRNDHIYIRTRSLFFNYDIKNKSAKIGSYPSVTFISHLSDIEIKDFINLPNKLNSLKMFL